MKNWAHLFTHWSQVTNAVSEISSPVREKDVRPSIERSFERRVNTEEKSERDTSVDKVDNEDEILR